MDIDIDIEEHNIFDNPALKAIFPDISALKEELEYENEVFTTNSSSEFDLDTKLLGQADDLYGNKIIIGSKPWKRCCKNDIRNVDVKLKKQAIIKLPDISNTLRYSYKFCNHCLILFPSITSFIYHKRSNHPQCVNSTKIANETKVQKCDHIGDVTTKPKEREPEPTSIVLCFHCNSKFTCKQNLIDHLYKVLEPKLNKQNGNQISSNKSIDLDASTPLNIVKERENEFKKVTSKIEVATTIGHVKKEELLHQCLLCSYYFKGEKYYNEHMFNKHNINKYAVNKASFSPNCIFCLLHCSDIKTYNRHIYNKHKVEVLKNINAQKTKIISKKYSHHRNKKKIKDSMSTTTIQKKSAKYLQCHLCCYYFKEENFYKKHMLYKHKINNPSIEKVSFSATCKFCSMHYNNIKLYNDHLYKRHKENIIQRDIKPKQKLNKSSKIVRKVNNYCLRNNILLPKSTLFRCCKCNMVFISPSMALNHTEHMEILINRKCGKCNLYFKRNDFSMHLLQHNFSDNYTTLEISTELIEKLLYSCPRCTIHFQENKIFDHYKVCENETPHSVQCSICDILIDAEIKSLHHNDHTKGNMNDTDFFIIDMVDNKNRIRQLQKCTNIKTKVTMKKTFNTTLYRLQNNHMYFCKTCKCFVSKLHKVHIHKESQCTEIIRYPCKFCGLILTGKCIMRHRQMHYENKLLKLQDFTFYDLYSGKKICPPIPVLPKCESCNLHFVYKSNIKTHVCGEKDFKICPFCGINLANEAYEIHVPFHKYEILNKTMHTKDNTEIPTGLHAGSTEKAEETTSELVKSSISVAYCCKICSDYPYAYDEVVEHCHIHLVSEVNHTISHKPNVNVIDKVFNFDPFYYGSENNTWLKHLYGLISNENIDSFLTNSIYRYESRIKMEISQDGLPEFTEYKCGRCYCFVDRMLVFEHIDSCMKNVKYFVCEVCTLPFLTKDSLEKHLQTHTQFNVTQNSLRIVTFNKKDHKHINGLRKSNACEPYVVYKCRNCEGLVNKPDILMHDCNPNKLKMCSDCGLLLYNTDYDLHIKKHKQFESFNENNIKVILVGNRLLQRNEAAHITKNSFIGVVCDYSFYKCTKCEVCIKNFRCTSKHFCLVGSAKSKCWKCGLYFDEGKLKGHLKLHLNDPHFVKDNIFTVSFDPPEPKTQNNVKAVKNNAAGIDESNVQERREAKIYKCVKCKLHFLTESSAKEHIKKQPSRVKIQNCTKCGFAFTSSTLFNHLLEHHGKKYIVYDFEVINVTGTFKKQKIFKCKKCYLHFTNTKKMQDHRLKCEGDPTKGEKCKYCGVMFHFSYLLCHKKMHEYNMHVDYEVETTED